MARLITKKTKREAVRDYRTQNMSLQKVAEKYGVSAESVRRWSGFRTRPRGTKYTKKRTATNAQRVVVSKESLPKAAVNNTVSVKTRSGWSAAQEQELIEALNLGYTAEQTAELLGRSLSSVLTRKYVLTMRKKLPASVRFRRENRRSGKTVVSNTSVSVKEGVVDNTPTSLVERIKIQEVGLKELAALAATYGLNVTVMVTPQGTEVKLHQ